MPKPFKTVLKVFSIVLISVMSLMLLANLYLLFERKVNGNQNATVFGFTSAVVLTGSMEAAISPNDMVIVHKQADYEVNDIVMYEGNVSTVTHRIIKLGENGYITKGDANNTDDGEISRERIIGKVILIIPSIGRVILFFQTPLGMLVLLLILFMMIEISSIIKRKKQQSVNG